MARVLAHSALFISLSFFPWWMTLIVALGALFLVRNFYEIVFWGIATDLLYGVPVRSFFGVNIIFTASFLAAYVGAEFLKRRLRLY